MINEIFSYESTDNNLNFSRATSNVQTNYEIKLIDFGFSLQIEKGSNLTMFCGTPCYMAPEIISSKSYKGKPTDIWSLGIILYIMVVGRFPFRSDNKDKN